MNDEEREAFLLGVLVGAGNPEFAAIVVTNRRFRTRGLIAAMAVDRLVRQRKKHGRAARNALAHRVVGASAAYYLLTVEWLLGRSREALTVEARQVAMVVMRQFDLTVVEIGHALDRDHSTVIHGLNSLETKMMVNRELRAAVQEVTTMSLPGPKVRGAMTYLSTDLPHSEAEKGHLSTVRPLALEGNATHPRALDDYESRVEIRQIRTTSRGRAR